MDFKVNDQRWSGFSPGRRLYILALGESMCLIFPDFHRREGLRDRKSITLPHSFESSCFCSTLQHYEALRWRNVPPLAQMGDREFA